jgi:MoaA/NifB/PqqE/SkfB family radical SAM enzyme
VLSLTGGEPFFNVDLLRDVSSFAQSCGLFVSAVTNAFWAETPEIALEILTSLPSIKMLAVSTDIYHQKSIPFERIENAVFASKKLNIPVNIHICTENEKDEGYKRILENAIRLVGEDSILTAITFPAGRALEEISVLKHEVCEEPAISACPAGSSPIIFPDGRVIACIGPIIDLKSQHPLVLGNLNDSTLESILNHAETNPILHSIRIWGPKRLVSLVKKAGLDECIPKTYIKDSICDACYALMSNDKTIEYLNALAKDKEFSKKVAYARLYYLNESEMIKYIE